MWKVSGMAAEKTASKSRSRTRILHYVLSFCVTKIFGSEEAIKKHPQTHGGISGFVKVSDNTPVQVGDLVLLEAAPATKWQIGWLAETRSTPEGWTEYLIESLEDGSLCWWSDVGLCFLKRDAVQAQWRWDDRQWAFKDRWFRVCDKAWGASDDRPLLPDFGDGFAVTIGTRTSNRFDDIGPTRTFPDYRKVTKAMMAQCYAECVAEREKLVAERKAVGETV